MRCAIYTRKSHEERADATLGSLENQRAYCSSYVASQGGNGWSEVAASYDDGGLSGGNLRRPALTRLREDIATGRVDVVVVYKIDRLSRSLRDFTALMAEFEAHGVSFVSVTQSFDTSTSMGRLMLNVLLSFAQFERELTGERLRDWFAGARERGLWMHGLRPYGYRVENGNLTVDPDEARVIRQLFRRYPAVGSARLLTNELTAAGVLNKFGRSFTKRTVTMILQNRLYLGDLVHRGKPLPGQHEAIVSRAAFARVQTALAASGRRRSALRREPVLGLLNGMVFDATGHRMTHVFVRRRGKLYRYYISSHEGRRYGAGTLPTGRFRAADIEAAVWGLVERLAGNMQARTERECAGALRRLVERIDIAPAEIAVRFRAGGVATMPIAGRLGGG